MRIILACLDCSSTESEKIIFKDNHTLEIKCVCGHYFDFDTTHVGYEVLEEGK